MIKQELIDEIKDTNLDTLKVVVDDLNYMIKHPDEFCDEDFKKRYVTTEILDIIDTLDVMLSDDERFRCNLRIEEE